MSTLERANSGNYSLGGVRLLVNELLETGTPDLYRGFIDLGCIEEAPINNAIEFQEHFCAASGTRVKDRRVVKQIASTIRCTLAEMDAENCRLFFMGDEITEEAAANIAVADEIMSFGNPAGSQPLHKRILKFGPLTAPQQAAIVVNDLSGAPYTVTTHYTVETYLGMTAIRPTAALIAHANYLADAGFVSVDYTYARIAARMFKPLTNVAKDCQVLFVAASDTGNEILGYFDKCQINPEGDFNWNSDDFSKIALGIDILDNTSVDSTTPFGKIRHLGTGVNI